MTTPCLPVTGVHGTLAAVPLAQNPLEPRRPASPSADVPFRAVLHALGRESAALDATLRATARGGGPTDDLALLALQARMYRYSEQLDLAGRLLEKATSAVKQTLSANT